MKTHVDGKVAVVIPNWNGIDSLGYCIDSLLSQSIKSKIIVVENGSTDGSIEFLSEQYPSVTVLPQKKNLGFAGGVNAGINFAIENGFEYVALFNNDAIAERDWLEKLLGGMVNEETGITTCSFMSIDKKHLDSTGDQFTVWGLPYPRGRGETNLQKYKKDTEIFAASGGASLYRISMLKEIGLFDEDFFAYYEDVDVSFRAQLAGWKVKYVPEAIAYHDTGSTSRKIKGFTTYQTMKNQPLLVFKNVPEKFLWRVSWRFAIAHTLFFLRAVSRGQGWIAIKGDLAGTRLLFKKAGERRRIQKTRKVSDEYIWSIITHDLPPNAHALRKLRSKYWKLRGKKV